MISNSLFTSLVLALCLAIGCSSKPSESTEDELEFVINSPASTQAEKEKAREILNEMQDSKMLLERERIEEITGKIKGMKEYVSFSEAHDGLEKLSSENISLMASEAKTLADVKKFVTAPPAIIDIFKPVNGKSEDGKTIRGTIFFRKDKHVWRHGMPDKDPEFIWVVYRRLLKSEDEIDMDAKTAFDDSEWIFCSYHVKTDVPVGAIRNAPTGSMRDPNDLPPSMKGSGDRKKRKGRATGGLKQSYGDQKSKKDAARLELTTIKQAVNGYYMRTGQCPKSLQDLVTSPNGMSQQKWAGPYLEGGQAPTDPWGNPYRLQIRDNGNVRQMRIIISSSGVNGLPGDEDDLSTLPRQN